MKNVEPFLMPQDLVGTPRPSSNPSLIIALILFLHIWSVIGFYSSRNHAGSCMIPFDRDFSVINGTDIS